MAATISSDSSVSIHGKRDRPPREYLVDYYLLTFLRNDSSSMGMISWSSMHRESKNQLIWLIAFNKTLATPIYQFHTVLFATSAECCWIDYARWIENDWSRVYSGMWRSDAFENYSEMQSRAVISECLSPECPFISAFVSSYREAWSLQFELKDVIRIWTDILFICFFTKIDKKNKNKEELQWNNDVNIKHMVCYKQKKMCHGTELWINERNYSNLAS